MRVGLAYNTRNIDRINNYESAMFSCANSYGINIENEINNIKCSGRDHELVRSLDEDTMDVLRKVINSDGYYEECIVLSNNRNKDNTRCGYLDNTLDNDLYSHIMAPEPVKRDRKKIFVNWAYTDIKPFETAIFYKNREELYEAFNKLLEVGYLDTRNAKIIISKYENIENLVDAEEVIEIGIIREA